MAKSKLIKDTTRAEREEIIKLALAGCGNGSCDNCGSCSLGAGDPYGTYQPYIDGEMEIADINMMVAERNAKLFGLQWISRTSSALRNILPSITESRPMAWWTAITAQAAAETSLPSARSATATSMSVPARN